MVHTGKSASEQWLRFLMGLPQGKARTCELVESCRVIRQMMKEHETSMQRVNVQILSLLLT